MKFPKAAALGAVLLPGQSSALIGYGIEMYNPLCAYSCGSSLSSAMLACSEMDHEAGAHSHGAGGTTPECRAGDVPYLTTLAHCISSNCEDFGIEPYRLEEYWAIKATGDASVVPSLSYANALAKVEERPTEIFDGEDVLNKTLLVDPETWSAYMGTLRSFELAETRHSTYGIILLVVGFGTPIVLSLMTKLPFMTRLVDRLNPYLVFPATIGTYHVRPLPFLLGNAPTRGQSLYIAMFVVMNIIFTAVGYKLNGQPNMWFASDWEETMGYISCRTGVLAFALAPLVILFAGRNNFLLWITGWPHSTFMLLHRWVARLFAIQVVLHSITELVLYKEMGAFETETKEPYWIWGIVATLCACIMLVSSLLWLRIASYEIFLISHVLLAMFTLIGSWYHVELLFSRKWGYEMWLYAAFAVWGFDRLVRVLRVLKAGVRRSSVTSVTHDIVRIDVEGIRWAATPGRHAYVYFPTLSPLRPWENHPFSVVPTRTLRRNKNGDGSSPASIVQEGAVGEGEKNGSDVRVASSHPAPSSSGVTLYIRKSGGLTKLLSSTTGLATLLDGPYRNTSPAEVVKCDRLILIAGGIGITGVLSYLDAHLNIRLAWSVKRSSEGLATELRPVIQNSVNVTDANILVGSRLDVEAMLAEEERMGWQKIGVVVCGPGGLCDRVRDSVAAQGRGGHATWELDVDAFSW